MLKPKRNCNLTAPAAVDEGCNLACEEEKVISESSVFKTAHTYS